MNERITSRFGRSEVLLSGFGFVMISIGFVLTGGIRGVLLAGVVGVAVLYVPLLFAVAFSAISFAALDPGLFTVASASTGLGLFSLVIGEVSRVVNPRAAVGQLVIMVGFFLGVLTLVRILAEDVWVLGATLCCLSGVIFYTFHRYQRVSMGLVEESP